ncbi:ATP-binding protein [Paenisporosarcina antarctica]|uniref:ATP-binding protein n=1 Tax=Paenisporosarcina antarctica TaxID=417367 RepID=UPI001FBB8B78|nr:ATP-binding protein [Paenisporosarcina antarctica]
MQIILPHAGIVLVIGPSNSGKSTLLKNMIKKKNILSSEIISSDVFRVLVSDIEFINLCDRPKDEEDNLRDEYNSISKEAFDVMDSAIEARCRLNKLTFVDATHLHCDGRKRYISLARKNNILIVSIVLEIPEEELLIRDRQRQNPRGERRIKEQYQIFKREKRLIIKEEYDSIHLVKETKNLEFIRLTNPIIKDIQQGIDIIGDIHGCYEELILLLEKLGYKKMKQVFIFIQMAENLFPLEMS